jgi:hypothetical protein
MNLTCQSRGILEFRHAYVKGLIAIFDNFSTDRQKTSTADVSIAKTSPILHAKRGFSGLLLADRDLALATLGSHFVR